MNDLIKREDAIKAIMDDIDLIDPYDFDEGIKKACIRRAAYKVKLVPSAEKISAMEIKSAYHEGVRKGIAEAFEAPGLQGWTPCYEALPGLKETVLITTFWGVKTGYLDHTEAYGDFWEIIENDATTGLQHVYAWMPLPEPYRRKDDDSL